MERMSMTAQLQARRAAKKLARRFAGVDLSEGLGEALQEASYEEAMQRNVYQSEDRMEEWLDWRTWVEEETLRLLNAPGVAS